MVADDDVSGTFLIKSPASFAILSEFLQESADGVR